MDFTEYTSNKARFNQEPSLCNLFKLLAIETWKRIEYAYLKPGVKVFETTLTQNLIFSINAYNDQYNLGIEIFEAKDEKRNGNDFELIIKFPKDNLEFYAPIQAKKIYRTGQYCSMDHGDQIVSFLNYAKSRQTRPFYLLYNYSPTSDTAKTTLLTGCSIVGAQYIYDNFYNQRQRPRKDGTYAVSWKIPFYDDLNPKPSLSWHKIVCPRDPIALYRQLVTSKLYNTNQPEIHVANLVEESSKSDLGFYAMGTHDDIERDWRNIRQLDVPKGPYNSERYDVLADHRTTDLLKSNDKKLNKNETGKSYQPFSPKSRIVLTNER